LTGITIIENEERIPQNWITKQADGSMTYNFLNFWFAKHNQVWKHFTFQVSQWVRFSLHIRLVLNHIHLLLTDTKFTSIRMYQCVQQTDIKYEIYALTAVLLGIQVC
jgi:hypothetical protein